MKNKKKQFVKKVIPWNKGLKGLQSWHNISGLRPHKKGEYKHSTETLIKMSLVGLGKKRSEYEKKKISEGLKRAYIEGRHSKIRIGGKKFVKGQVPWNKGGKNPKASEYMKKFNPAKKPEVRKKISKSGKGKHNGLKTEFKKGDIRIIGKNNILWNNGSSFEPYGKEFDKQLRSEIRKRDNFICQECGYSQKQLNYTLHVHHVDYNKKNNDPSNLISLCRSCHSQTNYSKEDWIKYFQNKIKEDYARRNKECRGAKCTK